MTHIYFAAHLLEAAGHDPRAVPCSLFPQIDRSPAYYHRLYAHSVAKAMPVTEAARTVYWTESGMPDRKDYFQSRIADDKERIARYVAASPYAIAGAGAPPDVAAHLAFISHLYNDQFNNPIQAFVPFNVYPSGAWALWDSIDSAEFRWYLYDRAAIEELRNEVFAGAEWQTRCVAEALTAAMITRLAKASVTEIEREAVDAALQSVNVLEVVGTAEHKEADELLAEHDGRLADLIRTFATPRDFDGRRRWAGEGY